MLYPITDEYPPSEPPGVVGRVQMTRCDPVERVLAAAFTAACAVVSSVPLLSKTPTIMGARNVAPLRRRPLMMPEVVQETLMPTPAAQSEALRPVVEPDPVAVQSPTSSPVVLSIESPLPGTVIVTLFGKYALMASKNVSMAATAPVAAGRA